MMESEELSSGTATWESTPSSPSKSKSGKGLMARAQAAGAALKRGMNFAFSPSTRGAQERCLQELEQLVPGDFCEVLSVVTMREQEDLASNILMEVPAGAFLEVLEIGEGRRIQVKFGRIEGWISYKTKLDEPLVCKSHEMNKFSLSDFEEGGQHEVKSLVAVRDEESLDSGMIGELQPGAVVRILQLGLQNTRRAKVVALQDGLEGWISLTTSNGELLVGKVSDSHRGGGMFAPSASKVKSMLESARCGDLRLLKQIVEGKGMFRLWGRPNLNASDVRGKTALIFGAAFGHKEVVRYLLSKSRDGEKDVNIMDDTRKTALHHASKRARNRRSQEEDAAQQEIIKLLLAARAVLEARDHNGCTALTFAAANGDEAVTSQLMTARANLNVKDFEGHTPLDYAHANGHTDLVQTLLDSGAVGLYPPEVYRHALESGSPTSSSPVAASGLGDSFGGILCDVHDLPTRMHTNTLLEQQDRTAETAQDPTSPEKKKKKKVAKEPATAAEAEVVEPLESAVPAAVAAEGEASPKKKKVKSEKTGEKGEKKSRRKASVTEVSAVMMEALGGNDEGEELVVVEEDAGGEVDQRAQALARLKAVSESSQSVKELEEAIKAAAALGAGEEELHEGRRSLQVLKDRAKALENLRQSIEDRSVVRLKEAIARAEELQVSQSDIDQAKAVLAEEEPKKLARDKLKSAQDSGNTAKLKAAIAEGKRAGLRKEELKHYEELLAGAESKEKAEAALKSALAERNVASLRFAISQAEEAGLDAAQIEVAKAALAEEEPRQLAQEKLAEVCEKPSLEALRGAIAEAMRVKLAPAEYAEAQRVLQAEEEKERLLGAVKETLEKSKQVATQDIEALREAKELLNDAIQAALKMGVPEAMVTEAEVRRKKLHNMIEDLKGSIRVFCRVRPLSRKEKEQGDTEVMKALDTMTVQVNEEKFAFDAVFVPGTQEQVFEDCQDLVQSAVDGYNVTMFAYGQTGAGKTFTMYGAPGMEGTAPRTIKELFRVIEEGKSRFEYTVMASMLELYRNDLVDLLAKGNPSATKSKLNIRQEKSGTVLVEHLTEELCQTAAELSQLLDRGNQQRTVAATAMNSESSRSHLVLVMKVVSVNRETKEQLRGKILLCDLAGSERLKKSQVSDEMQKEAIEINKSLTSLGNVIEALTKGSKVIPYRDHKLTQLLQDSLGGTAKTLMFVNCSPANSNFDETMMSLKYATRAKKITNTTKKTAAAAAPAT